MNKAMGLASFAAIAALAGCGGEEKAKAPAAQAREMSAGQWQSSLEVTNFRQTDQAPQPLLNMPVGTRSQGAGCIAEGETRRPPPQLFVGPDFKNCVWGENFYMGRGSINGPMTCQRDGVGEVEVTVVATFTADRYEGRVDMLTRLAAEGDVILSARAQGSRTGPQCAPEGGEAGNQTKAR
ncbi:MAG TPA: DUF3617 family protein [Allosphingosinicella sp.]|jgi:hypothetical protein